mgnify:CR=1 FL=1
MKHDPSPSSDHLDLPAAIYQAVERYTARTGVSPSIYDIPVLVGAPISRVRPLVLMMFARGHVDGDLQNLRAVKPPAALTEVRP